MKSIRELREQDARRLAERLAADPTPAELEAAKKAMRKFYLFAARYQRSFYTSQDREATEAQRRAADQNSENAYRSAKEALAKYRLKISTPGLYPIIEETNGTNFTYGHWY